MVTLSEDSVAVQSPPAAPEYPALHVQAVRVILPAGELALAGQLLQIASPLVALYDPATHTVHVPWCHRLAQKTQQGAVENILSTM